MIIAHTAWKRSAVNKPMFYFFFLSSVLVKKSFSHFSFFPDLLACLFFWAFFVLISPDSFPFEKWLGLFGRLLHFLSGFKLYSPTLILKHFDIIRALLNIDHSAHLRNHYIKACLPKCVLFSYEVLQPYSIWRTVRFTIINAKWNLFQKKLLLDNALDKACENTTCRL